MHALPTLQVVFSEKGEGSCPAVFSPLSYPVLVGFFVHASIPSVSFCLCKSLFCCPRPCTCPNFLLHCFRQLLPTLIHLFLTPRSPPDHFFCVFIQRAAWLVLHLFSRPFFHFFLLCPSLLHLETYVHAPLTQVPFA